MDSTVKIRELNDAFRTTLRGNGDVYLTSGVAALPEEEQAEIVRRVQRFDAFTPDNDPHYEHDFGSFKHAGKTVFWKLDYFDRDRRYGSPDPADENLTERILTVMLAEEYWSFALRRKEAHYKLSTPECAHAEASAHSSDPNI